MPARQPPAQAFFDVAVIVGSASDVEQLNKAKLTETLDALGLGWELAVLSAHRHAPQLHDYCAALPDRMVKVVIAVAGLSAALPGAVAAQLRRSSIVVIGVGLSSSTLMGLDALLSITRMPPGIPVACTGLDTEGLKNAALLAGQIADAPGLRSVVSDQEKAKPAEVRVACSTTTEETAS